MVSVANEESGMVRSLALPRSPETGHAQSMVSTIFVEVMSLALVNMLPQLKLMR